MIGKNTTDRSRSSSRLSSYLCLWQRLPPSIPIRKWRWKYNRVRYWQLLQWHCTTWRNSVRRQDGQRTFLHWATGRIREMGHTNSYILQPTVTAGPNFPIICRQALSGRSKRQIAGISVTMKKQAPAWCWYRQLFVSRAINEWKQRPMLLRRTSIRCR